MNNLPSEMKAVKVNSLTGKLEVKQVPMPVPSKGEVLVRIFAAPVNPSDLAVIRTALAEGRTDGFVPGIEASGTVVGSGGGLLPSLWKNRRVTCSSFHRSAGTWAEYMVTKAGLCFPLRKNVSNEQGSMTLVNPLTAIEFISYALKEGHKTIVNNAAGSALGRMVEFLASRHGIGTVNIVRSNSSAEALKRGGSKYVLNSTSPGFTEELKRITEETEARLLFDSVCGEGLNDIISAMPRGSEIVIYGNLTGTDYISINPRNLIDRRIRISGFYLADKAATNGLFKNMINLVKAGKLMESGMEIKISERYSLDQAQKAVDAYLADMSAGKVLLIP